MLSFIGDINVFRVPSNTTKAAELQPVIIHVAKVFRL
jgi:hypothetical protein